MKSSRQLAKEWPYPCFSQYRDELRKCANLWFESKGHQTHPKMNYCLDELDNWDCNIILPEVFDHIKNLKAEKEKNKSSFPLHKYVHHGLSSQAMIFNLVGPLITQNDYQPLIHAFEKIGIKLENEITADFEFEDRKVFNEDSGQPTSIDLVLLDKNKNPFIFIESKLAEVEFGGCSVFTSGDCNGRNPINNKSECYLHHIGRKYWDLLEKHGFNESLKDEKVCILINYYQFFRELLFSIENDGLFILLYDKRSPVFDNGMNRGLMPFLKEFIPEQHKDKINMISIQEIVESIEQFGNHSSWISDFKLKYGLI